MSAVCQVGEGREAIDTQIPQLGVTRRPLNKSQDNLSRN